MRARYKAMLLERFPQLTINVVGHHNDVGPYIATTDILLCFSPPMADHVVRDAPKLKWIQALGTGVDNIIDLPSLGQEVLVTNVRGIHGAPVSEATLAYMQELVALAKSQPGKLNFASSGPGSMPHLAGELFRLTAGINIIHVPYRGAAPAVNDLLAQQVQMVFLDLPVLLPQIKAGKLKPIAVGTTQRVPSAPDVPTTVEAGMLSNTLRVGKICAT